LRRLSLALESKVSFNNTLLTTITFLPLLKATS
jgi:hypothetical protein